MVVHTQIMFSLYILCFKKVSHLNKGHSLSLCLGAVLDLRSFFPAGAKYMSCMISVRPHIGLLYSYWFKMAKPNKYKQLLR